MQKKISITLLFTVVIPILVLFGYTGAIAGDCGLPLGECWFFNKLKHTIKFMGATTVGNITEFKYEVTQDGNINMSHMYFGIPTCKGDCMSLTTEPTADQFARCVGDVQSNVGIGDCEHCWIRFNEQLVKNVPEAWYVRVSGPVNTNTIPIQAHSGNTYEVGTIFGPACVEAELIEQTQVVVTTAEGGKLRITTDREGNIITLEEWDPDCNNGEGCWVPVSFDTIPQEEVLVCVPWVDGDPGPTYIDGEPYYCDFVRYITDGTDSWAGSGSLCGKFVCGSFVRYPCR